jgi:5'-deoxynucleotidase YfbR-like HD superfamily hydrolase
MKLNQGNQQDVPTPKNVNDIINFIIKYESVFRFSRNRLIFPENLVSHIGTVTILGTYIMDMINDLWVESEEDKLFARNQPVFSVYDYAAFMRRAVVHDMDEIVTGDIVRPTKYANEDILKHLKALEERSVEKIIEEHRLPERWKTEWENAKNDFVGLVLKVADLLSVMITCYRECVLFSNKQFEEVAQEAIEFAKEFLGKLEERRDRSKYEGGEKLVINQLHTFILSSIEIIDRRYI